MVIYHFLTDCQPAALSAGHLNRLQAMRRARRKQSIDCLAQIDSLFTSLKIITTFYNCHYHYNNLMQTYKNPRTFSQASKAAKMIKISIFKPCLLLNLEPHLIK